MVIEEILRDAVIKGASDIFVVVGLPITYKISGHITPCDSEGLSPAQTEQLLNGIYELAGNRTLDNFLSSGDDDFSFGLKGVSRFRISAYKQRGTLAAVIRVVNFELPQPSEIGIPNAVMSLAARTKGLVLVTGPAGSGKSTTLACLIDKINSERNDHIITLEDPLECLHRHKKSIVSQREVSSDTGNYVTALRASLRQSPDVILLGEMRDYETISVAMTAAETGHLVFSTLHTVGAANTIDRIIDAFPPNQQHQIRIQLSMILQAVISQQLIPTVDKKVVPAFEIMIATNAIRNMIRESKIHQIDTVIQSSAIDGMVTMDASIIELYKSGRISEKEALLYSQNPDILQKKLGTVGA